MINKKFIVMLLGISVAFLLVGCGKKDLATTLVDGAGKWELNTKNGDTGNLQFFDDNKGNMEIRKRVGKFKYEISETSNEKEIIFSQDDITSSTLQIIKVSEITEDVIKGSMINDGQDINDAVQVTLTKVNK